MVYSNILYPMKYEDIIRSECAENGLDPALVAAIIATESGYDETVVSGKGAVGLMQLMPDTAEYVCNLYDINYNEIDLKNAECNIRVGCKYLRYLSGKFTSDNLLIAYNAGEGNARKWIASGEKPRFEETRNYIKRVRRAKKRYDLKYNK